MKWTTCNVGASTPESYGSYFAWGETSPKESYTQENCKTYGKQMGSICGDPNYDAATANWGSSWRLPTLDEIKELYDKCSSIWTTCNGVDGYVFKSKRNSNAIFLPAAGYIHHTSLRNEGFYGNVWSGSPSAGNANDAYILGFSSSGVVWSNYYRHYGQPVRPVAE